MALRIRQALGIEQPTPKEEASRCIVNGDREGVGRGMRAYRLWQVDKLSAVLVAFNGETSPNGFVSVSAGAFGAEVTVERIAGIERKISVVRDETYGHVVSFEFTETTYDEDYCGRPYVSGRFSSADPAVNSVGASAVTANLRYAISALSVTE